jgi:hypothetical protein
MARSQFPAGASSGRLEFGQHLFELLGTGRLGGPGTSRQAHRGAKCSPGSVSSALLRVPWAEQAVRRSASFGSREGK